MRATPKIAVATRHVAALAALVLAGCATPPPVETVHHVPVACINAVPTRPDMPTESLRRPVTVDALLRSALAEIDVREAYELEMRALLAGCVR